MATPVVAAKPMCMGHRATIVGTNGRDVLTGTPRRDVIVAKAGNDVIRGGAGNDVICAGAGDDRVWGQGGHDRVAGQGGHDRIFGGGGVDRLLGGVASDVLAGGPGPDVLAGQGGNDRLDGGIGVDRCVQGRGAGLLTRCELPAPAPAPPPPPPSPILHDLTGVLAIAYSDIDGLPGYSTGDVLIAKLVDKDGNGPDSGDIVVMGKFPMDFAGTSFGDLRVTEHVVDHASVQDSSGYTSQILTFLVGGGDIAWYVSKGAFTFEWYQEQGAGSSAGVSEFFDVHVDPDPTYPDGLTTQRLSVSHPLFDDLYKKNLSQADDVYLDVELPYQKP
jgi:hypothetical protein